MSPAAFAFFSLLLHLTFTPYCKYCLIKPLFSHFSNGRRWFLDMIVEVGDARILKFLETRFEAGDLSATEALETTLLSINHLLPIPELVEMAKVS